MAPGHIAIVGGGLTGLSTAFHLSRRFPTARITLIEKQARLGGWVRSERVNLPDIGASVVLEAGPRTLRPNGKSVLELINLLNLQSSVITVAKSSPAAKARFLYIFEASAAIPSIAGLQRLPSSILSVLGSPLRSVLLPAVLREPFKRSNRPPASEDESVDSFLTRRFGEPFARTFGSALVHGIYAADSRKLSVRAAFPTMLELEDKGMGSMVRGFLIPMPKKSKTSTEVDDYNFGNVLEAMKGVSVYSFRDGMETLTRAMEEHLISQPSVNILRQTSVTGLTMNKDKLEIELSVSSGETLAPTHVVSALPLPHLESILSHSHNMPSVPNLTTNPLSTVHVVNFVFPGPPSQIHPPGFGYLIPRPTLGYPSSPSSANSAPGMLGVVFDSCSLHEQDTPSTPDYYTSGKTTKLTVMTGGPYPTLPALPYLSSSQGSDIPEPIRDLLRNLEMQLGKQLPDPIYWRVWPNEECIPTLMPGHIERMKEMKGALGYWDGRLDVIGAGVGGVSVGDCIEAGKRVGQQWG